MIHPKGFFKNSFLYFGIISVILFGILVFSFCRFSENSPDSVNIKKPEGRLQNLFVGEIQNIGAESPDFSLIQRNSLIAFSPPVMVTPQILGAIIGEEKPEIKREIIEYTVQPGDTLSKIAKNFGISLNTLLWANDLNKNSKISIGQKLIILPVSGVMHFIQKGETLGEIAKTYKADIDKIISFNELSNQDIFAGDILIIPDGVMPPKTYFPPQIPLASSYFICPIPSPCRITQGLHWYNAIDFSNRSCGEPVYSAAGGIVQRTGYDRISGNFIRIEHPNGVITGYGHLSKILVSPGQQVYQGEIIGYTGYSGYTIPAGPSGCHLHFEVRGARNPFAY